MCILDSYGEYLSSSDLQFGFKKGTGCNRALYTVRSVAEQFTAAGSVVNLYYLDVFLSPTLSVCYLPSLGEEKICIFNEQKVILACCSCKAKQVVRF